MPHTHTHNHRSHTLTSGASLLLENSTSSALYFLLSFRFQPNFVSIKQGNTSTKKRCACRWSVRILEQGLWAREASSTQNKRDTITTFKDLLYRICHEHKYNNISIGTDLPISMLWKKISWFPKRNQPKDKKSAQENQKG